MLLVVGADGKQKIFSYSGNLKKKEKRKGKEVF
jgi:hypothetical protein